MSNQYRNTNTETYHKEHDTLMRYRLILIPTEGKSIRVKSNDNDVYFIYDVTLQWPSLPTALYVMV